MFATSDDGDDDGDDDGRNSELLWRVMHDMRGDEPFFEESLWRVVHEREDMGNERAHFWRIPTETQRLTWPSAPQ
jgi:hypothetical protein